MRRIKKCLALLLAVCLAFPSVAGTAYSDLSIVQAAEATTQGELLKAGSISATEATITEGQPFAKGTAGSNIFRIPCLISLKDEAHQGTLVAAADVRYTEYRDFGGIDTIASVSTDNGKTWNYSFPIYFPDSNKSAGWEQATTAIDPALVEGPDGTIYCFADMNPTGITTFDIWPGPGTGFVNINGVERLALTGTYVKPVENVNYGNPEDYEYYVGDFDENGFAPVLNKADHSATEWGVDEWYNIYTVNADGEYEATLTQKQVNSNTDIQQNAFYAGSVLHVYSTGYIWCVKSYDGGLSWEDPEILNTQIKRNDGKETALLVSPGQGMVTSDGDIIVGAYDTYNGENASIFYSTDNGQSWKRSNDVNVTSSENEIVELPDGTLRMFYRNQTGKLGYADIVKGDNGEYTVGAGTQINVSSNSNCNVSAILLEDTRIDGKPVILVTNPEAPVSWTRVNGKVFVFTLNEDNSMDHVYTYSINEGEFAYSCMTELDNGNIGMLWEPGINEASAIRYDEFDVKEVLGKIQNLELSVGDSYTKEASGSDALEIVQEPDNAVATITREVEREDAAIVLHNHTNNAASSVEGSFSATADETKLLDDAQFTFTASGSNWKIFSEAKNVYLTNVKSAGEFFSATEDTMTVAPSTEEEGKFTICRSTGSRYVIFYNKNMDFNSNGNFAANYADGTYSLMLLEKQSEVSDGDLIPGYKQVTEIVDGHKYIIAHTWSDGSVFVLYPTNGTSEQTKLVGKVKDVATTTITITAVGVGETTAVVDDVVYNIVVPDPALDPEYAGNDYPVEDLTAICDSQYLPGTANEGPDDFILDGNKDTHWHTNWKISEATDVEKRWVGVRFEEPVAVGGVRVLPRINGGSNGNVTEYKIQYRAGADGEWIDLATGTWSQSDTAWKRISFDAVMAKEVRIVGVHTYADSGNDAHMSLSEFRVVKGEIQQPSVVIVDKTALNSAIAAAEALNAADYTEESWTAMQSLLTMAKVIADSDVSQFEVDYVASALEKAIEALVEKEKPVEPENPNPSDEEEDEVSRLFGATRYETGYKVADALKEELGVDKFEAVVVATGKNFADALAGSYLAVQKNAPIILTNGKADNITTLHTYIKYNVVTGGKVYILGGESAVPNEVAELKGYDVVRLAGQSRYETNLAILEEAGITGDELIVATGKSFADSLSASATKLPILLTKPGAELNEGQMAVAEKANKIYIIGGEGAVDTAVEEELTDYGDVVRVFGETRYETSIAVANTFFADVDMTVAANAKNFPDGLCGGPLAAAMNAPLILTADAKTEAATDYMKTNEIASGYVLGGSGALTDESVVEVLGVVPTAPEPYKIGVITGTPEQNEEENLAAKEIKERYGDKIVLATFPDNFMEDKEGTIEVVENLAADPEVKVIVFVQAIEGAADAINKVKETRDDILFITGVCADDPEVISEAADICMVVDEIEMGTTTIDKAAEMGAKTFVHISFERHLNQTVIAARQQKFKERCAELGITYVEAAAPDPVDVGVEAAKEWVTENVKVYVEQYGKDTAFFCTNCGMQAPLIQQVAALGAIFPQQCCPSPYHGYPEAFGITQENYEWYMTYTSYMMSQISEKVAESGNSGRMATWTVSINEMMMKSGVEYGIQWCEGKIDDRCDDDALLDIMKDFAGDETSISKYYDETAGEIDNYFRILCPYKVF